MILTLIVAVAENGVIGRGGGLPWRMPSDLKTFRRLTMGKPVVMGRRTWATLKKPLDGRDNIVVTRDAHFEAPGATVAHSLGEALGIARVLAGASGADEIMVIGGATIYEAALPLADRVYWTTIHGSPQGDTYFPALDATVWQRVSAESIPRGENDEFAATLEVYERKSLSGK